MPIINVIQVVLSLTRAVVIIGKKTQTAQNCLKCIAGTREGWVPAK